MPIIEPPGPNSPPAKTTFQGALYRRWVQRMPANNAITALAHRLLIIVYHVLVFGQPYQELGPTYHDERDRTRIVHQTVAAWPAWATG
jgi:transposase